MKNTIKAGNYFVYNNIEFVCLETFDKDVYGSKAALAVTTKIIKKMKFDISGKSGHNNWETSSIRKWLNSEFISEYVEVSHLLSQVSDLTSESGDDKYGTCKDYVTLLSIAQCQKYQGLIPKYKNVVWTLTPYTSDDDSADRVYGIASLDVLGYCFTYHNYGVVPVCLFNLERCEISCEQNQKRDKSSRKSMTKNLSDLLEKHIDPANDSRIYWAKEVTFDYGTTHSVRVDYMKFCPLNNSVSGIEKGDFFCYEIKSSVDDFHSVHGHNFIGDYNYYVMPEKVYDAVKEEIPRNIGVYVPYIDEAGKERLRSVKTAKRVNRTRSVSEMLLMMFRSANRRANYQK